MNQAGVHPCTLMATGLLRKTEKKAQSLTNSYDLISIGLLLRGYRAMKNRYVAALFVLAMGLGVAFVVAAVSVASLAGTDN
jgi:hypothetical protein